jgi:hypothetical protein
MVPEARERLLDGYGTGSAHVPLDKLHDQLVPVEFGAYSVSIHIYHYIL